MLGISCTVLVLAAFRYHADHSLCVALISTVELRCTFPMGNKLPGTELFPYRNKFPLTPSNNRFATDFSCRKGNFSLLNKNQYKSDRSLKTVRY